MSNFQDVIPYYLLDMTRKHHRLKTFVNWPVTFLSADVMAENGFYYLGNADEVRCAFCKVLLMKWEEGDDPAQEHRRWAPHCRFVLKLTDSETDVTNDSISRLYKFNYDYERNVKDFFLKLKKIEKFGDLQTIKLMKEQFVRRYKVFDIEQYNKSALLIPVPPYLSGAVYPEYASQEARLRSFQDSLNLLQQKPENLAEAGFFYFGPDDNTKCFCCGGGIRDWEIDDIPWEQHARWFGSCAYVKSMKGCDYAQKVMNKGYNTIRRRPANDLTYEDTEIILK